MLGASKGSDASAPSASWRPASRDGREAGANSFVGSESREVQFLYSYQIADETGVTVEALLGLPPWPLGGGSGNAAPGRQLDKENKAKKEAEAEPAGGSGQRPSDCHELEVEQFEVACVLFVDGRPFAEPQLGKASRCFRSGSLVHCPGAPLGASGNSSAGGVEPPSLLRFFLPQIGLDEKPQSILHATVEPSSSSSSSSPSSSTSSSSSSSSISSSSFSSPSSASPSSSSSSSFSLFVSSSSFVLLRPSFGLFVLFLL
eukprot:GHVT01075232.1.p2 GENE.GHVT01075232.1~~GHVT01075232.1.p2  ORF type:complete len:259 (+),score=95.80 GHVT01075232.1:4955-5731(+)